jgi:hypothetical protein
MGGKGHTIYTCASDLYHDLGGRGSRAGDWWVVARNVEGQKNRKGIASDDAHWAAWKKLAGTETVGPVRLKRKKQHCFIIFLFVTLHFPVVQKCDVGN